MLIYQRKLGLQMELRLLISWPWNGEIVLDYPQWTNVITGVLITERGRQESESDTAWERLAHELSKAGRLWKLMARAWILPLSLQKQSSLTDTVILSWRGPLWTSNFQNCQTNLCCRKLIHVCYCNNPSGSWWRLGLGGGRKDVKKGLDAGHILR